MPNWCMNDLTLTGPKDVIDEIAATKLSLDVIFPCPKELKDTVAPAKFNDKEKAESNTKKFGFPDWYEWQVSNWGTKWDIGPIDELYVEQVGDDLYEINAHFDSAWSPPVEAMQKLHDKYKDRGLQVWMEYFEPGCAFLGTITTVNGIFNDEYREFSNADDLEEAVRDLNHNLAESEVEYLREREAEELESEVEEEAKANVSVPIKKTAKKPTKTVSAAKKPVKKVKKPAKSGKTTSKTSVKKPAKKAVKPKKAASKSKVK